jgi:hypothetical protein
MVNEKKLFIMSRITLVVTAISFALRASLEPIFMNDYGLSATDIRFAFGPAFYGFTFAMFSVSIVLPIMGVFIDTGSQGSETLRYMAILPALLIVLFGVLYSKYGKKIK